MMIVGCSTTNPLVWPSWDDQQRYPKLEMVGFEADHKKKYGESPLQRIWKEIRNPRGMW